MKQFNLTFTYNPDSSFNPKIVDKIEADDLVELLSQFLLIIARLHLIMSEDEKEFDDDIPF